MKKSLILGVVVLLLMSGMAFGQFGFNAIGVQAGYFMPEDIDNCLGFGVRADLGTLGDFGLIGEATYWKSGEEEFGIDIDFSQINIAFLGKYAFGDASASVVPYAAAGLGFAFSSMDAGEFGDDSETDLGIHLRGGIDFKVSDSLNGFAEFTYTIIDELDLMAIMGGVYFPLGK